MEELRPLESYDALETSGWRDLSNEELMQSLGLHGGGQLEHHTKLSTDADCMRGGCRPEVSGDALQGASKRIPSPVNRYQHTMPPTEQKTGSRKTLQGEKRPRGRPNLNTDQDVALEVW